LKRSIIITPSAIGETSLLLERSISTKMGAVVTFLGYVRDFEGADKITGITYESFDKMAHHQFGLILDAIEKRWPVESVRLVHRIGHVPVNEPSLWVEVIAPHRGEAFAATQFLIDEMKLKVPIWKKPNQT